MQVKNSMTITLEEARELLSGSPQDNQFRAAVGTLNTYNTQNRELSGLKSGIVSGTYAEGENWNPGQGMLCNKAQGMRQRNRRRRRVQQACMV